MEDLSDNPKVCWVCCCCGKESRYVDEDRLQDYSPKDWIYDPNKGLRCERCSK